MQKKVQRRYTMRCMAGSGGFLQRRGAQLCYNSFHLRFFAEKIRFPEKFWVFMSLLEGVSCTYKIEDFRKAIKKRGRDRGRDEHFVLILRENYVL